LAAHAGPQLVVVGSVCAGGTPDRDASSGGREYPASLCNCRAMQQQQQQCNRQVSRRVKTAAAAAAAAASSEQQCNRSAMDAGTSPHLGSRRTQAKQGPQLDRIHNSCSVPALQLSHTTCAPELATNQNCSLLTTVTGLCCSHRLGCDPFCIS